MTEPSNGAPHDGWDDASRRRSDGRSGRRPEAPDVHIDVVHPRIELLLGDLREPVDLMDRVVQRCATVPSPVGEAVVCWNDEGVSWLRLWRPGVPLREVADHAHRPTVEADRAPQWLVQAVGEVSGADVSLDLEGLSAFQRDVLLAAASIPRGETRPYAWVARQVGRPQAVRAVGSALGHNPVPLLLPCHRVVRSDGSPGQYIFGEDAKRSLLEREGAL